MLHIKYKYSIRRLSTTAIDLPLQLAKDNLRVDSNVHDAQIGLLIESAKDFFEGRCDVVLSPSEFVLTIDRRTICGNQIYLPKLGATSINDVTSVSDGIAKIEQIGDYELLPDDEYYARIECLDGFPNCDRLAIDFNAGVVSISAAWKRCLLAWITHQFENPSADSYPAGLENLIRAAAPEIGVALS